MEKCFKCCGCVTFNKSARLLVEARSSCRKKKKKPWRGILKKSIIRHHYTLWKARDATLSGYSRVFFAARYYYPSFSIPSIFLSNLFCFYSPFSFSIICVYLSEQYFNRSLLLKVNKLKKISNINMREYFQDCTTL